MTIEQVFDRYINRRVQIETGRVGVVIGTDPRPKPSIDGQHYVEGNWLCIKLDPQAPYKIGDIVYRLPEQITLI